MTWGSYRRLQIESLSCKTDVLSPMAIGTRYKTTSSSGAPIWAEPRRIDMLQVERVDATYGDSQILRGVSLEVGAGEVVCLLGRNGAGVSLAKRIYILSKGQIVW